MVLRRVYMPVRPEMDRFLFARVGEEVDGIPLSVRQRWCGWALTHETKRLDCPV